MARELTWRRSSARNLAMKLDRTHQFSKDEALARLQALTDYWGKYGVKSTWRGDRAQVAGKIKGVKFEGDFSVQDGRIVGNVKAGFLAEKLGGQQYVDRKLTEYLDPSASLDDLKARK